MTIKYLIPYITYNKQQFSKFVTNKSFLNKNNSNDLLYSYSDQKIYILSKGVTSYNVNVFAKPLVTALSRSIYL